MDTLRLAASLRHGAGDLDDRSRALRSTTRGAATRAAPRARGDAARPAARTRPRARRRRACPGPLSSTTHTSTPSLAARGADDDLPCPVAPAQRAVLHGVLDQRLQEQPRQHRLVHLGRDVPAEAERPVVARLEDLRVPAEPGDLLVERAAARSSPAPRLAADRPGTRGGAAPRAAPRSRAPRSR